MKRMMSPPDFFDFLEDGFQAIFEFAAILGSRDHRAEIQRDDAFSLQRFRNIAGNDALRQPFDNRGLADAGLANQDGIVLGSARQNLNHAADFFVAPNHRIELAFARKLGEIARIALQAPDTFLRDSDR